MAWLAWIWGLAGVPVHFVANTAGIALPPIVDLILRVVILFLVGSLLLRILSGFWTTLRGMLQGKRLAPAPAVKPVTDDPHAPPVDMGPSRVAGSVGPVAAGPSLDQRVRERKAAKDYAGIGEIFAEAHRYAEAATWYKKAGNARQAALMLGKSGAPAKAAKMLLKAGDFVAAGAQFEEAGRALDAAKAYERGGRSGKAAQCYLQAKRHDAAIRAFLDYFQHGADDADLQFEAAEQVHRLLADPKAAKRISPEARKALLPEVAKRFEQVQRYDVAGALYEDAGDLVRAGEVYLLGGELPKAALAMSAAGRDRDASQIHGRYHAQQGRWQEAAQAYVTAGEFLLAGDCYRKGREALRAAECYEKAKAPYHAAVAYAHAGKFDYAIRQLQQIRESDKDFDASRALLGRCFFEKKQYYDCAAALENYLTGRRVESGNKEYYYMLALACEQINRLSESLDILRKIHSVDTGFKDVAARIESLSSQLALLSSATTDPMTTAKAVSPDADRKVSEHLGARYRLDKELGRGGMGVVYKAHDTQLDRPVALKFIGDLVDSSEEFRQRFIREAQAAARINHPNIVSIYDISASQGKAYIAMEFVDGGSLARLSAKEGKLDPRRAVALSGQACAALAAIHEAGVIHRDIKPDNILLAKGGGVKLTDFGLARSSDNRITRTGTAMGTPAYMAPEQVLGKEADARSDIYALGLVLHQLLTGTVVFGTGNVLERQLNEMPPAPSEVVPGIPAELDAIVMRCVAKAPDARYHSARELLNHLQAILPKLG